MKKCPYCAEELQDEAIKCRFCGEHLKKRWRKNCFFSCLIAFIASIVLIILFMHLIFAMFRSAYLSFVGPNLGDKQLPFTGGGIEGIVREFAQTLKALWERLKDIFQMGPEYYNRITF